MEPLEWVALLYPRLIARRRRLTKFDRYYRGRHPLLFASDIFQEAFGGRFKAFADNWIPLVVDTVLERLGVRGFRWGEDLETAEAAWRIWQANKMDARGHLGLKEALIHGVSYNLVWPGKTSGEAHIFVEHPRQMIVDHAPGNVDDRNAALKVWNEKGVEHATLYLPDKVHRFRRARAGETQLINPSTNQPFANGWVYRQVAREHGMGAVPVVPMINRPRLLDDEDDRESYIGDGESEANEVMPLQDGINKTVMDAFVGSEFVALPQRYATNFQPERDVQTGKYVLPWKVGAGQLWWVKPVKARPGDAAPPDPKFGQFAAGDLTGYVKLIEMLIQHVASITRTPPHYFGQISGQFPSGESLKSAEAGLVAKAKEKQLFFGEGLEETMRLALRAAKVGDADRVDAETVWRDPESRTEGEHTDSLLKQQALGIPDEFLWAQAGYSQTDIKEIKRLRDEQALREAQLMFAAERDSVPLPTGAAA